MTWVENYVRACDLSLRFLRGSELAVNSNYKTDRSVNAVAGIWVSCTLLMTPGSWCKKDDNFYERHKICIA